MSKTRIDHQLYLLNTYPFRGKTFTKGQGAYLIDDQGGKYLDFMTNFGVNIFGYNHPVITKALKEQLNNLPTLHGSFANEMRAQAAKMLVDRCGGRLKKVYFSNSGTEAIEAALKFALITTKRKKVIAMEGAFHGKTIGSLSITHQPKYREGLEDFLFDVEFVPFGSIVALKEAIDVQTCGVILEPIQGESGVIVPPAGYLREVQNLCQESGALLVLDEIQTGVGRTGAFLASQKEDVVADIVCLGKGLAGGIPVGVTLVTEGIAKKIPRAFHTSTLGGNPLACRGIIETLNLLDDKMLRHIEITGKYFIQKLKSIKSDLVKEVRGTGLMVGIEMTGNRDRVLKGLQKEGTLASPAADIIVRLLPPYIVTKGQIDKAASIFEKVLINI